MGKCAPHIGYIIASKYTVFSAGVKSIQSGLPWCEKRAAHGRHFISLSRNVKVGAGKKSYFRKPSEVFVNEEHLLACFCALVSFLLNAFLLLDYNNKVGEFF